MGELKRIPLKYIRDYIKRDYKLRDCCYICGSTTELELHHIYSLSDLFDGWCKKNKVGKISTVEQVQKLRIKFKNDNQEVLSNKFLFTLCNFHHKRLHYLFGQVYGNYLVPRVKNWLDDQKEKELRTIKW